MAPRAGLGHRTPRYAQELLSTIRAYIGKLHVSARKVLIIEWDCRLATDSRSWSGLASHATLNSIPVIVVSARDPEVNRPKAEQAGAIAFFQKPADFDELLKAIRHAVGDPARD